MGEEVWSSEEDVDRVGVYTKIWKLENNDGNPIVSNLLIYRIELKDPSDTKSLKKKLVVIN